MITTTPKGELYRKKFSDEIKQDIEDGIKYRQASIYEETKESDFCVFVRENGYMVIFKDAYKKLSKKNKKIIERSYEYRQIAE